jgi:hypothetical protein
VRLIAYALGQFRVSPWFAVAPLAGLLVAAALVSNLPMQARWSIAQDNFDRVVRALPPGEDGEFPAVPERVGTYRVVGAERVFGGVRFATGEDFFGADGFAWFPNRAPSRGAYEHLRGDWYVWSAGGFD